MIRLIVNTQVFENYGAHDWNGLGECPQHWKAKFGYEYLIHSWENIDALMEYINAVASVSDNPIAMPALQSRIAMLVENHASPMLARDDEYYREYVIDYEIYYDSLTSMEETAAYFGDKSPVIDIREKIEESLIQEGEAVSHWQMQYENL